MKRKNKITKRFNKERNDLESLVSKNKLYCIKHRQPITLEIFYKKRCYMSRKENIEYCPYLTFIENTLK